MSATLPITAQPGPAVLAQRLAILSPGKDFALFFLSSFVVFAAWFASAGLKIDGFIILAVVAVSCNAPHLISTWTRVYFGAGEWRARPLATVVMPLLVFGAVFAITLSSETVGAGLSSTCSALRLSSAFSFCRDTHASGPRLLNSIILYWATWHFVAQNWGILRIYQRKSGEAAGSLATSLERPILLLSALWCLLHRLMTGPRALFGVEVFYVDLPRPVVDGLLGPLAVLAVVYAALRLRQAGQPHGRAGLVRLAFLACSFVGFFVPFVLITTDDTTAFAAAACWHAIQYLGIVRHYNVNTWRGGVALGARIISWLSQPGAARAALYFAGLLAVAGSVYGVIYLGSLSPWPSGWSFYSWAGVVWVSLTLSHYWLDGVIWKLRRPDVASRVGL